jgi:hypothetical protein
MEEMHWVLEIAQRTEICLDGTHERSNPGFPDTAFTIDSLFFADASEARKRQSVFPSRRDFQTPLLPEREFADICLLLRPSPLFNAFCIE